MPTRHCLQEKGRTPTRNLQKQPDDPQRKKMHPAPTEPTSMDRSSAIRQETCHRDPIYQTPHNRYGKKIRQAGKRSREQKQASKANPRIYRLGTRRAIPPNADTNRQWRTQESEITDYIYAEKEKRPGENSDSQEQSTSYMTDGKRENRRGSRPTSKSSRPERYAADMGLPAHNQHE